VRKVSEMEGGRRLIDSLDFAAFAGDGAASSSTCTVCVSVHVRV